MTDRQWVVTRTWTAVTARTAGEAIEKSAGMAHDQVHAMASSEHSREVAEALFGRAYPSTRFVAILCALGDTPAGLSGRGVARQAHCSPTSAIDALRTLQRLGAVRGTGAGRAVIWQISSYGVEQFLSRIGARTGSLR